MKAVTTDIIDEADEIKSFRLKPETEMKRVAGQWMYVRLSPELKHQFTISSSPTEDFLQFTTKFREESEYKNTLWKLGIGAEVEINGPFGSFTLDENDTRPRIFIAGGIGITPFRSQIKYIVDRQLSLPVTLLYSAKTKSEMAFATELEAANGKLGIKIALIETSTMSRVNGEMVKRHCPDWQASILWLCGPPAMVDAGVVMGQKMGYAPENIKSEEFTGY